MQRLAAVGAGPQQLPINRACQPTETTCVRGFVLCKVMAFSHDDICHVSFGKHSRPHAPEVRLVMGCFKMTQRILVIELYILDSGGFCCGRRLFVCGIAIPVECG